jgi:aminoglycoside phosphotransferase (APT) family kinase protein
MGALEDLLVGRRLGDVGLVQSAQSARPNPWASRNASVLMDLRTSAVGTITIVMKGGSRSERTRTGQPWGPAYEADVYRAMPAASSTYCSPFLATIESGDVVWLVLRWIDGALPLNKAPYPAAITSAASWLGGFHREAESLIGSTDRPPLIAYGNGPVVRWIELARQAVLRDLPDHLPLLNDVAAVSDVLAALLADAPTLVHGDLYPSNMLVLGQNSIPIDWEWAGVGAGELDVAALTDGWSSQTAEECLNRYRTARWPLGEPDRVEQRIAAARIFLAVRWLGGHPLASGGRMMAHQLKQLRDGLSALGMTNHNSSSAQDVDP